MCHIHSLEALLDLKKQRLLLSLQPLNKDTATAENSSLFSDEEQTRGGREDGEGERGGSVCEEENDNLQGIKCQAPLKEVLANTCTSLDFKAFCFSLAVLGCAQLSQCCYSLQRGRI